MDSDGATAEGTDEQPQRERRVVWAHQTIPGYTHHWMRINDTHYLSLQTAKNVIDYFKVTRKGAAFEFAHDSNYGIRLDATSGDVITHIEYSKGRDAIIVIQKGETGE